MMRSNRKTDREPMAWRIAAEHRADVAEILRQAERNISSRHVLPQPTGGKRNADA